MDAFLLAFPAGKLFRWVCLPAWGLLLAAGLAAPAGVGATDPDPPPFDGGLTDTVYVDAAR
ncbi:MAG: hypothetical protein ACYDIE_13335, partial [Candidatus Krumholzibacteriia bacterium]